MNEDYPPSLLDLINELHLNPQYGDDFITACRHKNFGQINRTIKAYAKRSLGSDLFPFQVELVRKISLLNYEYEINRQGIDMDALPTTDTIFQQFRYTHHFKVDYSEENSAFERRELIHRAIKCHFGDVAFRASSVEERKELMHRFDNEFSLDTGTESKTRTKADQTQAALTPETEIMTTLAAVEVRTFIYGKNATTVSDDVIFIQISDIETQIAQLNKIDNKPMKLVAKINALQDDIIALINFVDARPAA